MTLLELIQDRLRRLPPEKQSEVLDYVTFLQQRTAPIPPAAPGRSLRQHPAFGAWRARAIDALHYEQTARAEWDR
jgi:lysozyme family protein